MKGIQPIGDIHPRTISSIAKSTSTSVKEVCKTANDEEKRPPGKPNLRLEARLKRAQGGCFR